MADAVRIEGLADLRRDLRKLQPDVLKEMRGVFKEAAGIVAARGRVSAPRATGRLAGSIRPGTAGNSAFVRARVPYAAVHEYGGTIKPKGTPITIKRSAYIGRALEDTQERIVDKVGDGIDAVARRHGWK